MIFTNASGNMQPYRSWKGKSTRASIPANSRPFMNSVAGTGANEDACVEQPVLGAQPTTGSGGVRGPNPIKHWRKQLNPRKVDGISAASYSIQSDMPGANVHLGVDKDGNPIKCCFEENPNNAVSEYIPNKNTDSHDTQDTLKTIEDYIAQHGNKCGPPSRKPCCNPESNRIRSGMTTVPINSVYITDPKTNKTHKIEKSYSFSTKEYLRSKNKTYKQNLSGAKIENTVYSIGKDCCATPVPYGVLTDSKQTTNDNMNREYLNGECCVVGSPSPVIVKPNNQQYFQQGAVDSSSRLARLKYNTINKNAQSFRKPFGDEAVSAAQYTASGNTPFFIKSITQQPQCPRPAYRPDAFTVCSVTNPAETYRQNKTTQVVSHSNKY